MHAPNMECTYFVHSFHHLTELWKVNRSTAVNVNLVHHIEQFLFCWILTQRSHCDTQLLGGNRTVSILERCFGAEIGFLKFFGMFG